MYVGRLGGRGSGAEIKRFYCVSRYGMSMFLHQSNATPTKASNGIILK